MILAIDPGWNSVAWAIGDRVLKKAGTVDLHGSIEHRLGILSASMRRITSENYVQKIIIEQPRPYYEHPADEGDILKVAFVAGVCAGATYLPTIMPIARDWKGTMPKDVHNRRILAKLSESEKSLIPTIGKKYNHNIVDAVGMWLWYEEKKTK